MNLNEDGKMAGTPFILGLTGGIGTGKSTAAGYLAAKGPVHIDADAISRQLTEKKPGVINPVLDEIGRAFGAGEDISVLREDGSLDRAAMARLVFRDPKKKELLEDILFRHIIAGIHRQIDAAAAERAGMILLDVPLLFECGLDSLCDKVILLTADHDVRVRRVMERDGCDAASVEARIRNQMPDEEKIPRADFIVDNSGTRRHLQNQLDRILDSLADSE